jgi:cytochrome c biogenesis protein CcmG/thiol:disulfide interchange protein DsbE
MSTLSLPRARYVWIIGVFAALIVVLAVGLRRDPSLVPSPLIGKPAPSFELPLLQDPGKTFSEQKMIGKVWLLNVWASWCVSCRDEHPVLVEYAKDHGVPIYGLDYKDKRTDALAWLHDFGDPYKENAFDADGRVGINFGVYGVPETYVIDKRGIIRYKQIGPVTPELMNAKILPMMEKLARE